MGISEFFSGKNIFVTGGSGFLGKVLIEKLLRSCPDVGNIYILIRSKKGKSPQERWDNILENVIFDRLRETNPNNLKKVVLVEGDTVKLKLGLSEFDRHTLIENVNIIYHMAASVHFDVPLKTAILENVRSTTEIIELAKELRNLVTFVHISTTYCNCDRSTVEEKIYPSHGDWKDAIKFVEEADPHIVEVMSHKYIYPHPNTYTYSKSLAEQVVLELCKGQIPTIILRPSIVINTITEPFPGWNDNLNGPIGLFIAGGKGLLRVIWTDSNRSQDYVPVDAVARVILMSTFEKYKNRNLDEVEVYNVSKYKYVPLTNLQNIKMFLKCFEECPTSQMLWYPRPSCIKCWYYYYIQVILFHLLPAVFLDILMRIFQRKPIFLTIQRKIYIANTCVSTFLFNDWDFVNDKMIRLSKNLPVEDKNDFDIIKYINLTEKEVLEYNKNSAVGVLKFLLKDDYSDMEKNHRLCWRMWLLDVTVKTLFLVVLLWYIFVKHDTINLVLNTVVNYIDRL